MTFCLVRHLTNLVLVSLNMFVVLLMLLEPGQAFLSLLIKQSARKCHVNVFVTKITCDRHRVSLVYVMLEHELI